MGFRIVPNWKWSTYLSHELERTQGLMQLGAELNVNDKNFLEEFNARLSNKPI
jgi:hypothetical protein